jgi:hypothetical protein
MPLISTLANASARGYGMFGKVASLGAYESISTVTVGSGGSSTITFSSIPSTYKHLQLRSIHGTSSAGTNYMNLAFNGVGGTSYSSHTLYGNGSTAGANAGNGASASSIFAGTASVSTTAFGASIMDFLDYANTNKYKTTRHLVGIDSNGTGGVELISGLFMSTNAITSFTITGSIAFAQYSSFALYGIKG